MASIFCLLRINNLYLFIYAYFIFTLHFKYKSHLKKLLLASDPNINWSITQSFRFLKTTEILFKLIVKLYRWSEFLYYGYLSKTSIIRTPIIRSFHYSNCFFQSLGVKRQNIWLGIGILLSVYFIKFIFLISLPSSCLGILFLTRYLLGIYKLYFCEIEPKFCIILTVKSTRWK